MSTQYGTLSHRKTVQVPMWLIAVLVVGLVAVGIGYTVDRSPSRDAVSTSVVGRVTGTNVAAGGIAAAQHAGIVFPGGLETSGVIPSTGNGGIFPDSQVVIREGAPAASSSLSEPIVINGEICHQCM